MKISSALALALSLSVAPLTARAQATAGNTNVTCSLANVVSGFTALKCIGFYSGNVFGGSSAMRQAQNSALNTMLGTTGLTYTPGTKINVPANTNINFGTPMYGMTVLGFHFGDGQLFNSSYNGNGGGSAFYVFDFGTQGVTQLSLLGNYRTTQSSATLYSTGSVVPEPSTYALMAAGLLGVVGVTRRRRNAQG